MYAIYYKLRRFINYIIYRCIYRIVYPDVKNAEWVFKSLSYSNAVLRFFHAQKEGQILFKSDILDEKSIIIDVGGDTGDWAMKYYLKYKPAIYIFEPNPESVKILRDRFDDDRVKIFSYGLGSSNQKAVLSNHGMGSSVYNSSPDFESSNKFEIEIRDVSEVVKELSLESIDLLKINIEGGEYELIPRMIDTGVVKICKSIRIQFHDWIPDAFARRKRIVRELGKTHQTEWSYPMVWESWIRKDLYSTMP